LQAYDDDLPYPHLVENGMPHARYALLEKGEHGWQVELLAVPYDWRPAVELAMRNGRPDWAIALRTGRTK
jgi:hypothetical protein